MEEVLGAETVKKLMRTGGLMQIPDDVLQKPVLIEFEGIPLQLHIIPAVRAMKTWVARPDDVFVVAFPKAGTTWTQEIVSAICNNGDLEKVNKSHTLFRVPYLELDVFSSTEEIKVPPTYELVGQMKSPRTIKTHLPENLLPPDVLQKKAKIVYVARNPKDVAVSFFHFHNFNPSLPSFDSWNEFFDGFYSGHNVYGPWWSHYLSYWNKRHESNVLFVKFEDMKQNLKGVVTRISNFLGYSFTEDVIDGIVHHCTFANMKTNPMTNPDTFFKTMQKVPERKETPSKKSTNDDDEIPASFMRKELILRSCLLQHVGLSLMQRDVLPPTPASLMEFIGKVGDWKNHFTVAQYEAMDAQILEKLAGTGLTFRF